MFRSRSWFDGAWNKPKNRLNTTVSESNEGLLTESLRSIAEVLIWGDQHDSSVFDFFLEKFLHIMRQQSGGSSFVEANAIIVRNSAAWELHSKILKFAP
uniref:FPL domain-containing protein n=1 Tax=Glossina palpalis gambiensis TaxID=67801 RepID=A0A1B0BM84_9MUSC